MDDEQPPTYTVDRADAGAVVTVTLRRANCLDIAGKHDLTRLFLELADDSDCRAVILASDDPEAMLVDVAELARMDPPAALAYSRAGQGLGAAMEHLPAPIIAAVPGPALGGGCELVLACDMALGSTEATFGQIEVNGGVVPAFGGTWRLVRRVGYQRACQLIFTGAVIDAATAAGYGLILEVLPADALLPRCQEIAAEIAATSRGSVAEAKHILTASSGRSPEAASALEQASFATSFGTSDQRDRMAAFLDARPPGPPPVAGGGPEAEEDQVLTLAREAPGVTFVNVWTTPSSESQRQLVEAMRAEVHLLSSAPGFLSMAFLRSTDGTQVVVLARWASDRAFADAVDDDPEALARRRALEAYGASSARLYEIETVYGPGAR